MKTDDLIGLLARDLDTQPVSSASLLWRWLPLAALAAAGLFLALLGLRSDITQSSVVYPTALKLGFGVLIATIAGIGAFRLVRPDASVSLSVMALVPVAALVGSVLVLDRSWMNQPMAQWTSVLRCITFIPVIALLPLAAFLHAMREGAVMQPAAAGALAGLASAGLAMLAYGLNCTEDSPLFVGLWYSLAAAITAGVGAIAAKRTLVW
jgi:hypothetical protein